MQCVLEHLAFSIKTLYPQGWHCVEILRGLEFTPLYLRSLDSSLTHPSFPLLHAMGVLHSAIIAGTRAGVWAGAYGMLNCTACVG